MRNDYATAIHFSVYMFTRSVLQYLPNCENQSAQILGFANLLSAMGTERQQLVNVQDIAAPPIAPHHLGS